MRVLLITNHFYPEEFRCNDLAFRLAEQGDTVTVLTSIPDYPKGKYHKGYGIIRKRVEYIKTVRIIRSFIVPRGRGGSFRLALNYFSSLLAQCLDSFFLALFGSFDIVIVHETSPVMVGIPGIIVSRLKRIPMLFWVLDLWPESLQDAGGVNNTTVLRFFNRLTTFIYDNSRFILISSLGFKASICKKGDYEKKIVYFPNWADDSLTRFTEPADMPVLPDGFRVLFAGNIGEAQDMDSLMQVALRLKNERDIQFCIIGDGRKKRFVEEFIKEHSLENTVHLFGRFPIEFMPSFFKRADLLLVTLKDSPIFNLTVPAKIQAYMNAGKPIVAMMNGEGPRIIAEARCGYSAVSGDIESMAKLITDMHRLSASELNRIGALGKEYCEKNFSFNNNMNTLNKLMNTML